MVYNTHIKTAKQAKLNRNLRNLKMKITSKTRRTKPAFVDYVPPAKPVAYQIRDNKVNSLMENRTPVLHYTLQSNQSNQISRSI